MQPQTTIKQRALEQQVLSLEMEWEFRYRRYLANAHKQSSGSNDRWFKLYYLVGDFMTHCISIVKQIVHKDHSLFPLDPFDHRFILKLNSESIYFKDNIVIRMARIVVPGINGAKDQANLDAQLLYQEFMANDIMNDLLMSMKKGKGEKEMDWFDERVKFHVPLCCLVEYMGFRAFCQADTLFHGYDTVAYGPISESQFRTNKHVENYLFYIGKTLNFKPYKVETLMGLKLTIPFSLKCQVHYYKSEKYYNKMKTISRDSDLYDVWEKNEKREEYYIYGISRLWPHYIDKGLENNIGWLRPEVLKKWPKALDASAFLGISSEIDEQSELQLADACKTVQDELTTAFAQELDKGETKYFAEQLGHQKVYLIDSHSVITAFHERGINLRFMGVVANKSQMVHVKTILKLEMVTKVLKNIFYTEVEASNPNIKEILTDYLNLIFSPTEDSRVFFTSMVYPKINEYFEFSINEFPLQVPGGGLLHAIMFHFGVDIYVIDYAFFLKQQKPPFTNIAVREFTASAMGFHFEESGPKKVGNLYKKKVFSREDTKEMREENLTMKLKQIELLILYHKGRNNEVTSPKGPLPDSFYYAEIADICAELGQLDKAYEYANLAIKYIPDKHSRLVIPLCVVIKYHSMNGQLTKSLESFDRALASITYHLGPNHPLFINVYNTIGNEFLRHNEAEKCDKILKKSFQICSLTFGYLHRSCSQILVILSKLPFPHSITVSYLTQVLTILEATEATEEQIKEICKDIAEKYEAIGDSKSMLLYAKKSGDWILQVKAAEKNHEYKLLIELCEKAYAKKPDISYLMKACFKAYLNILTPEAINRLYKVYVALKKYTVSPDQILMFLQNDLQYNHYTITRLVDECINTVLSNYIELLNCEHFYLEIGKMLPRLRDASAKRSFRIFVSLINIYGEQEIETLFHLFI